MNDTPHDEENRPEQPAPQAEPTQAEPTQQAAANTDDATGNAGPAQEASTPPAPPVSNAAPTQPLPPHPPVTSSYPAPSGQQGYGAGTFGQPAGQAPAGAPYGAPPQLPPQQFPSQQQATQQFPPQPQQQAPQQQAPQFLPHQQAPQHGSGGGGQFPPTPPTSHGGKGGKRTTGIVVAALVVGALVGGATGGTVGFLASSEGSGNVVTSSGPRNITVNNPDQASAVTAVAAKASPSIVTISVGSSSGQAAGTGSGIILSEDGYILTNTHVVTLDGEIAHPNIRVRANDGKLYQATVIGTDPIVDLAVIKLKGASGLTPAQFADSSKLNVGDLAVAIGAPLGLSGTVTNGIVSALNRSISIASSAAPKTQPGQGQGEEGNNPFKFWNFDMPGQGQQPEQEQQAKSKISLPVIQTDAAINPGNSGGALLDADGKVIGVNVAIASAGSSGSGQSGSIGVGFAIPSNLAKRVSKELINTGKASHGLLGASVASSQAEGASSTVGAAIHTVSKGGPAQKAGLKPGDVVTNFNGVPITDATDLVAAVRYLPGGATTKLVYVRDGSQHETSVTLGQLTQ